MAIEEALRAYEKAGMIVSLKCHPRKKPDEWFEVDVDFPKPALGVLGIEGLGVGDPTQLIFSHIREVNRVRIITDAEAKEGIQMLESHGISAVESAGANFFASLELAKKLERQDKCYHTILTVVTAARSS